MTFEKFVQEFRQLCELLLRQHTHGVRQYQLEFLDEHDTRVTLKFNQDVITPEDVDSLNVITIAVMDNHNRSDELTVKRSAGADFIAAQKIAKIFVQIHQEFLGGAFTQGQWMTLALKPSDLP